MIEIEARLQELQALGLHRRTRLISGPQGPHVLVDGKPALLLCSNNSLGLADHPQVREAAADAAMRWGVGAGGARLASGTMTIHRRLEERLAGFVEREAALVFDSHYLAAGGVVAALARPGDVVFSDELNHAAIVDGCRLSGAEVFAYGHGDVEHLAWGIDQAERRGALIVSDSLFSVDGDLAPLAELVELAQANRLRIVVGEAQAIGTLGPGGRGALAAAGLLDEVDVIVGSLGQALGAHGGFVACDRGMARYLTNTARPFAVSTALAPPVAAGGLTALELLEANPRWVTRLAANAASLRGALAREGWDVSGGESHILSLPVGDAGSAGAICDAALTRGVFVEAVRPPTVAAGTSRLRLAVMATHRPDELLGAARTLGSVARSHGSDPRRRRIAASIDLADSPNAATLYDFEAPARPRRRAA